MALFLLLLIVGAVSSLLLYSLVLPGQAWDLHEGEGLLGRLRKRKDRALRAIKDLEFEHETGSLSDEEFRRLRSDYRRLAIRAMKDLDRARETRVRRLASGRRSIPASVRNRLERRVESKRKAPESAGST